MIAFVFYFFTTTTTLTHYHSSTTTLSLYHYNTHNSHPSYLPASPPPLLPGAHRALGDPQEAVRPQPTSSSTPLSFPTKSSHSAGRSSRSSATPHAPRPPPLQELPERWETLKKQCDLVRQHLAPLKAFEVTAIRKRSVRFDVQQAAYRDKFRTYSFFLCVHVFWDIFFRTYCLGLTPSSCTFMLFKIYCLELTPSFCAFILFRTYCLGGLTTSSSSRLINLLLLLVRSYYCIKKFCLFFA